MKHLYIFLLFFIILSNATKAQNSFSCKVKDAETKENLFGVTASLLGTKIATTSTNEGLVELKNVTTSNIKISFSFVNYAQQILTIKLPQSDTIPIIYLKKQEEKLDEVVVTSARTNSRIEDLPTKVEVLGSEEVGEENGIKPGNIASMLGDIAGIQIQQSSATTGNSDARIQGLPGKYTQILRDGMPLFGGYAGSFSILQIPPSDLKQIEIIKGSSSTLYGGGAIAGMLNLISKSPKINKVEHSITINQSTLNESNINAFLSQRNKKMGYTLFTGYTNQKAVDVNKDGFSDVPDLNTFFFHPKLFFYLNSKQTLTVGYNLTYENRNGGDMQVLHKSTDLNHQFFIQNKSNRNNIDASWENKINANDRLTVKASTSIYSNAITTNVFGMKANQISYFTEISYVKKIANHNFVTGLNFTGEKFKKLLPDSSLFANYNQNTLGIFIQDDWKILPKFTAQLGLRYDYNNAYKSFLLPRASFLYKLNNQFSTRLGAGYGYKIPSVFSSEIDERMYDRILPLSNVTAEKSFGINWDINYKQKIYEWNITINQMFYNTIINKPLVQYQNWGGYYYFSNTSKPLSTKGFETYIAAIKDELELYFGYTYTDAKQLYNSYEPHVSLSAKNKFAAIVAYEFSSKFRAGVEASYIGKQYLDNGTKTNPYLLTALMFRYNIKKVSIVLNGENLFDYRQTKKENIVLAPYTNPSFKQIWAPIDGRVINLSAKIDF